MVSIICKMPCGASILPVSGSVLLAAKRTDHVDHEQGIAVGALVDSRRKAAELTRTIALKPLCDR